MMDSKKANLRKELKRKTESKLKVHFNKQRMERNRIQFKIDNYNKKIQEFISKPKRSN